jgi:hypothetical protein
MRRPVPLISGQRFGDLQVRFDVEIVEASIDGTLVCLPGDRAQTVQSAQQLEVLECNGAVQVRFDLLEVGFDRFPVVWRDGEMTCTPPELELLEDPLNQRSDTLQGRAFVAIVFLHQSSISQSTHTNHSPTSSHHPETCWLA